MNSWQQRERALAILSTEVGHVRKPHADRVRVALAFPNTYYVGMSNLGFQAVYQLFNAHDEVVCERVFLPPRPDLNEQLAARAPLLTLESQSPVAEFDVLAFSVSFEWDYASVLTILRLAGLPVRADDRTTRHPLVVVGGAITFVNPEPLAPFADVIAIGEGEALVPALVSALHGHGGRGEVLRRLATIRGFYVPSFHQIHYRDDGTIERFEPRPGTGAPAAVGKAALKAVDAVDPPATSIFTPDTEFGLRFLVEVVRGCANLCRFCWAGYNYLPVRAFPADRILAKAERARAHAQRAGLVSIALCDHPEIERILARLGEMGYSVSPASLRLDDLTEPIVRRLREGGERTFTIAPETGSDRLRRAINKTITNQEILDRAEMMFASNVENLKLYYMIGLPTETDDDLVAIRSLTLQLRNLMMEHARRRGHVGRIVGSVTPMIPKPSTAYQWLPMERPTVIERKAQRLRTLMADIDNVHFNIKSARHAFFQALLSLGDRRIAPAIEGADLNGGNWRRAVADAGVDTDFYLFRDRRQDLVLPWDIIHGGSRKIFFESEFEKSLRAECTLPPKRQADSTQLLPVLI